MGIYCDNCGCLIEDEDNLFTINGKYYYCCEECMEEDYFGIETDDEEDW